MGVRLELDRRQLLLAGAAALSATRLSGCSPTRPDARRVLLIDIDDVGWPFFEDCLANGDGEQLAALRASAREYRTFWSAPVCSVFRAKLLTGLESFRSGNSVGANVPSNQMGPFNGPSGTWITHQMPGRRTKRGKWHLSAGAKSWPDLVVELTPERDGYDEYSGPKGNIHDYYAWNGGRVKRGGAAEHFESTEFATNVTAREALEDVQRGVEFVHVSFNAAHAPHSSPPPMDEPPGTKYPGRSGYSDLFRHLDWRLGELIRAGITGDFVVLLACDNGTSGEGKGSLAEVGVHTPLLAWGRGIVPGRTERLVSAVDLWSTVRFLRGCEDFTSARDSRCFAADLLGLELPGNEPREWLRADAFPSYGIVPKPDTWRRAVRDARWKHCLVPDAEPGQPKAALYDLANDPEERVNLLDGDLSDDASEARARLAQAFLI